jgi:uncharacterized OsmC-like protein
MSTRPITVTHEGGLRFAAQIRTHQLIVDQPSSAGGADAGPMPIELLGASLATCVALYVQQFCAARGLSTRGLAVEVDQHAARNPGRIARFDLRVRLPDGLPASYLPALQRVAQSCPAHNTLVHGAEVHVEVHSSAVGSRSSVY